MYIKKAKERWTDRHTHTQTDRQTDKGRDGRREGERDTHTNTRTNARTHARIWTILTASPCYSTNTSKHDYTTNIYHREREGGLAFRRDRQTDRQRETENLPSGRRRHGSRRCSPPWERSSRRSWTPLSHRTPFTVSDLLMTFSTSRHGWLNIGAL